MTPIVTKKRFRPYVAKNYFYKLCYQNIVTSYVFALRKKIHEDPLKIDDFINKILEDFEGPSGTFVSKKRKILARLKFARGIRKNCSRDNFLTNQISGHEDFADIDSDKNKSKI